MANFLWVVLVVKEIKDVLCLFTTVLISLQLLETIEMLVKV